MFVVTLAVVMGMRMSVESMAVVVGVVCGVAAGIPVSLLILVASSRRVNQADDWRQRSANRQAAYPPVVVIQGGATGQDPWMVPQYPVDRTVFEPSQRRFHLVGGAEDEERIG
jgi:hypothetical protein